MPYKYSDEVNGLTESNGNACFINYSEKETIAYRWVFAPIEDPKNFIPIAKDEHTSLKKKCSGWALSFHETEDASKASWEHFINMKPNKYKKIGTHIAEGKIFKTDGKCSESDANLHFNLIEYKDVNPKTNFTIKRQLITDEELESLQNSNEK